MIQVENLTKDYGSGRGVFDVSFEVNKGEVFGFLGPNGSGKTTTIRHIMGFSNPDSGQTRVFGKNSAKYYYKILANVGYLPGELAFPDGLSGIEFLKIMQDLRHSKNNERMNYLMDKFDLDPKDDLKRMPLGAKRKLAIVAAFMSDPEVLVLDEPTSSLDPIMQEQFIDFIKEEKKRGKTILLSSHIFHEVDLTCDRIAIIKDGKLVSIFIADDLRHNENKNFKIEFTSKASYEKFISSGFNIYYQNPEKLKVKFSINDDHINDFIGAASDVKYLSEIKFTLEDYFMKFYREYKEFGGEL
jgi:ABC-2 type transport system ATP-binding protein